MKLQDEKLFRQHCYVDGEWVDAWSGERLQGHAVVERPAPLDQIPLFITAARAEELLPLVRPGELTEVS